MKAGDRFLPMGAGPDRGPALTEAEVAARAKDANLLVLHGMGADAPAWARELTSRSRRVLVFAQDPAGALAAGVRVSSERPGEWYIDQEPPPSPLIGEIAGLAFDGLPPLADVMPRMAPPDVIVPVSARLRGTGRPEAPLLLLQRGDRGGRVALSLAQGWWRWSLRRGAPDEAYQRIWAGVAGWLLSEDAEASQRVRPLAYVNEPGAPIGWTSAGIAPLRLTVMSRDSVLTDTTLTAPVDALRTPALPPGTYRYRAIASADTANGRFDVHLTSAELRHPRMDVPDSIPAPPGRVADGGEGRPLRAYPLPYLLLLGLLCGEWVARRRKGLR